jgi:hypothetical protein
MSRRGLKTLSGASHIGSTRSIQQAVRESQVDDWSPMPLTMLTEEESMFKDSGTCYARLT